MSTVDEIIAQRHRYLDGLPGQDFDESPVTGENFDILVAEIEWLRNALDEHWRSEQQGHMTPCTYGPLCPYCEIERLQRKALAPLARLDSQLCELLSTGHSLSDLIERVYEDIKDDEWFELAAKHEEPIEEEFDAARAREEAGE